MLFEEGSIYLYRGGGARNVGGREGDKSVAAYRTRWSPALMPRKKDQPAQTSRATRDITVGRLLLLMTRPLAHPAGRCPTYGI